MLPLLLFAAWLASAQQASAPCTSPGTAETQTARGPGGVAAVLKVSSEDDHSKEQHLCSAQYQLLISGAGGEQRVVDLLTSDDAYERKLSVQLSGFSRDGRRVLGILSEGGKHPVSLVFEYHIIEGTVQLLDLREKLGVLAGANCDAQFAVIGTTGKGGVVVELGAQNPCAPAGRWRLEVSGKRAQRLLPGASILSSYTDNKCLNDIWHTFSWSWHIF